MNKSASGEKPSDVLEGWSMFCLSKENKFRGSCYLAMVNPWFDRFIMLLITISTILLAFDTPLSDPEGTLIKSLNIVDYVFTSIFALEMLIKMITLGILFNGSKSYLRNAWNFLDFIIVTSALLSIAFTNFNLSFLKALRMLRILRPLRLISRNKGLKLAITSLINSIPKILNLLLIVLFFMFILAILLMNLFGGTFYDCTDLHELYGMSHKDIEANIKTKWDCLNYGGEWVNKDNNYDNLANSMTTLIGVQSTEGWV
jgi:hypothetical protein